MTFALITSGQASGASSHNDTFTSGALDTTGANLLIVNVVKYEGTSATLTDSKGNTWIPLTERVALGSTQIYYCAGPTVGSGHTFTLTGTNIWGLLQIQAWSGAHPTAPFDVENGSTAGTGTSRQPGSITPSENNELVVSGIACQLNSIVSYSINSSFTISHQKNFENPYNAPGALAYLVQTTAAAVNPTWSWTNTVNSGAGIASFKAASGNVNLLSGKFGGKLQGRL